MESPAQHLEQMTRKYWVLSSHFSGRLTPERAVTVESAITSTKDILRNLNQTRLLWALVADLQSEIIFSSADHVTLQSMAEA